jgi:phage shock protein C
MMGKMTVRYVNQTMISYAFKRSLLNRVFGGICGGIGEYLGISPWWVRLALVAVVLTTAAFGVLLYILLWFVIPGQTTAEMSPVPLPDEPPAPRYTRPEGVLFIGALAIIVGIVMLAETTGALQATGGGLLAPGMMLMIGIVLLLKHLRGVA